MSDEKCCTGCNIFYGGEIRHIKECFFYPESLTEIYDRKDEENAKLKEENARLREALEFYADENNWWRQFEAFGDLASRIIINEDISTTEICKRDGAGGRRAREALESGE